jgi:hypothetical protein
MVARVILGKKGSSTGLWVTKATKDVSSSMNFDDYLVDTDRINTQPILQGSMTPVLLSLISYAEPGAVVKVLNWTNGVPSYRYTDEIYGASLYVNGWALYQTTIAHGLGFVPLANISVLKNAAGVPVPRILIDATYIYITFRIEWAGPTPDLDTRYPNGTVGLQYPTSTLTMGNITIHYSLFRQSLV